MHLKVRACMALVGVVTIAALTWLWQKTQSVNPEDHAQVDSALRELRSLDRTINQDVLRARYQLISSYEPVLESYRRIEKLEAVIASPPTYLDDTSRQALLAAVADYQSAVTSKQSLIETFKYRAADLKELLGYLPGAGTGVAATAAGSGDEQLAADVNRVLQQTLLYNLTSDESYAPRIRAEVEALGRAGESAATPAAKRRVRTFVLNIRTLLKVKPEVDHLLARIFAEPVIRHEERVAAAYYGGYAMAENVANRYRLLMYGLCVALFGMVGFGVLRLQHTARALALANERLEERVLERTRELDARNRELRAVLDNVNQALFTVSLEGRISRERSAALDRWFANAEPGTKLWDVIEPIDAEAAGWLRLGWEGLREDALPLELILEQLPRSLKHGRRHYRLEYRPIGDGSRLEKILLVVSDQTEMVERERRDAEQEDQLVIFQQLMADRLGFEEFFAESERLVDAAVKSEPCDPSAASRAIHTLKGNSAMYGVTSIAATCHAFESKLVETGEPLDAAHRQHLMESWQAFADKARALIGKSSSDRIELTRLELQSVRQAVSAGQSSAELLRLLNHLEREPAERRLARISEQARTLAKRLGRGEIEVTTESNGVRLDAARWAPFWAAFVHMLRNAVDHGLEPAADRLAAGKPRAGHLTIRISQADGDVVLEVSDDGRGVDWAAVRRRALELGLPAKSEVELSELLFRGGVSTKQTVTEFSGRGTGVSACYAACRALGGQLSVTSESGRGTSFCFTIPSDDAELPLQVPEASSSVVSITKRPHARLRRQTA